MITLNGDSFVQDSKYVKAVNDLLVSYKKELIESNNRTIDASSIKDLIFNERYDFNKIRKTLKSMTYSSQQNNDLKLIKYNDLDNKSIDTVNRRHILIDKIEKIIENILVDITNGENPKFVLRNQKLWSNCVFNEKITMKNNTNSRMTIVNFKFANSRSKFCLILHLLSTIYSMLIRNKTCTKRELYYQNISRVRSQRNVDDALSAICCLLDTPQWELGLLSTSKGLIAGPLEIITQEENKINCQNAGGVLIPQNVLGIKSLKSKAKFILVIEKDTIFQKLLDEGSLERLRPFILLTGKGYPDINTRLMLKLLVDTLKIPSLVLVDGDPHGIEIMCTYKFGSLALSHISDKLAIPSLRWLGVYPSDIIKLGAPNIQLTSSDINKCKDLLNRPYCSYGSRIYDEVHVLLNGGVKTELEGIGSLSQAYLTDRYIPHKICTGDFN